MEKTESPKPGIYPNIDFETYQSWDAVNASLIKAFLRVPAMAEFRMNEPEEDKIAYVKGRLFHLLLSDPKAADSEFICTPPTYTSDKGEEKPWHGGAKICKQWKAQQLASGLTIIPADDMADAVGMASALRKHPKLGALFDQAEVEVSVVWQDPGSGILCKGRWDIYKRGSGIVLDPKSSRSAAADAFFAMAYRYGYHIQCAMYVDAMLILDPPKKGEVPWFVFGVVENFPPYLVRQFDVFDDSAAVSFPFIDLGRKTYKSLLPAIKHCMETGKWPGYEDGEMMLPPWVKDAEAFEMR